MGAHHVSTLAIAREELQSTTFACTFEQATGRLAALERMYCEPDGSFVWVSSQQETPWQVDGNLYDRDGRLLFVDLKGSCPPDAFERLLQALGWPQTAVMFQLTREALFVDEGEFRRLAAAN